MDLKQQPQEQKSEFHSNPLTYELLPNIQYYQHEYCCALAMKESNNILLAGQDNKIKVIQFKNGLKLVNCAQKHQNIVVTLNIFQNRYQFISGSNDSQIIIWSFHLMSSPKYLTKLKGHQDWIKCLVIRPKSEDLIISGSYDKTIKFWKQTSYFLTQSQNSYFKQQSWVCSQTITQHKKQIEGLSINQEGNKLITCGADHLILIIEEIETQWQIKQKIEVQEFGYRISFINNDLFAFQPRNNYLCLFSFNPNTGLYQQNQDIQVQGGEKNCDGLFPLLYLQKQQILISKNGINVNVLKFGFINSNDYYCKLEQVIGFRFLSSWGGLIYGTASHDGKYLITWDQISKEIQIRQLRFEK
ncbi:unnamed protein product (macronuclear) [Paramecium tetraurelia]|uniref:Uncharacterized protein n=1 Tax=Paramecium tetraurelia TaxID=5888 RepID=A0CUW3_PARTE|nr:uncharacterized protein GSPATT00039035001 [Paramecium tetraurelia]CAK74580.1 unnamed protein product [Paramecium tetraurelia]|eukprot:XP_001441977.1 hypothetical protein (macronuclear) [Paramecium tetraurelia strain d4-2]